MTTLQPLLASRRAVAAPTPDDEPVTIATLLFNCIKTSSYCFVKICVNHKRAMYIDTALAKFQRLQE